MKKVNWSFAVLVLTSAIAYGAPVYKESYIFPKQPKHVHGSSIVECPNGDLLACWFYGSGERTADDVMVQGARLKKGSDTWSPVFVMADTPGFPDCNPVLFIDNRDRLWLFWIPVLANRWQHSLLMFRRSEEYMGEGPPLWSWQGVIILKPGEEFAEEIARGFEELQVEEGCWGEYAPPYTRMVVEAAKDPIKRQTGWMTRIHPTQLPSGRILLPLYSDGFNLALVAFSDDEGETWQPSSPIVGLGPVQPSIVVKKDGTLAAFLRDNGDTPQRVMVSTSQDNGQTWSVARDTDIRNPGSSLEVIALRDGRWAMVHNDTEEGRRSLAVTLSDNEGVGWKWVRHLERGKGSYGYPSVIQARNGLIHATYSHHDEEGRTIKHVTFDVEWIGAGD